VLVPGDPERASNEARRQSGIPIDEESWRLFVESGLSVGVGQDRINALATI
jgi:LDH2 family malate/lactate/ureidoglycolate dehydrogenase